MDTNYHPEGKIRVHSWLPKKEVIGKSVCCLERLFFLIAFLGLYYSEFLKAAGVMPVRRLKYLLKKEGLGNPISSEI